MFLWCQGFSLIINASFVPAPKATSTKRKSDQIILQFIFLKSHSSVFVRKLTKTVAIFKIQAEKNFFKDQRFFLRFLLYFLNRFYFQSNIISYYSKVGDLQWRRRGVFQQVGGHLLLFHQFLMNLIRVKSISIP